MTLVHYSLSLPHLFVSMPTWVSYKGLSSVPGTSIGNMRPLQSQMQLIWRTTTHVPSLGYLSHFPASKKINFSTEIALFSMMCCEQTSDSLDFLLTLKGPISTQIKGCYLTIVSWTSFVHLQWVWSYIFADNIWPLGYVHFFTDVYQKEGMGDVSSTDSSLQYN